MNKSTRFEEAFSVASEDQYDQLAKGFVPNKTLESVLAGLLTDYTPSP